MTQRLIITALTSIGAVEAGDNPDADIMFYKSKSEPVQGHTQKEGLMGFDPTTLNDDAQAYISDLETKLAAATVEEPAVLPEDLDPVVKSRLDAQDEAIAKSEADKVKVEKDLAELRDTMATEKYDARADDLAALLGDKADVAPVLKALATADPDNFAKLDAMFDTLVVKDTLAPLFKELGEAGGDGTAADQITAIAKDLRTATPDLSPADARKMAWAENPALVTQSREES
jgi:hypothetical protein